MKRTVIVFSLMLACSSDKTGKIDEATCKVDADCADAFAELRECEAAVCSTDGVCAIGALADGTDCRDGLACTNPDYCLQGQCTGTTVRCEDSDPCTKDRCDNKTGCYYVPAEDEPCDDLNTCTEGDRCVGGQCEGGALTDGCCRFDGDCGDDDPCTDDHCSDNVCTHTGNFAPCDDGDACTGPDHCDGAGDCGGDARACDDGNPCTLDTCDPTTGMCQSAAGPDGAACEDGNSCTANDLCDGGICAAGTSLCECTTDAECATFEDGDLCNGTLRCASLRCVVDPLTVIACNPTGDSACVKNTCDPQTAQCRPVASANATFCDDQNPCTSGDQCNNGLCFGMALSCDDNNPCTFDACSPVTGCTHIPNTLPCSDDNACTGNDQCTNGACSGQVLTCDDGNACTDDACDARTGCRSTPNTAPCDDGDSCSLNDVCNGGACRSGVSTCECLDDLDCVASEDANLCNGTLVCRNNACELDPTSIVTCATTGDTTCKKNTCNPTLGTCALVATADGLACNDNNACTVQDACLAGACAGAVVDCSDSNACTNDSCAPATGCASTPNTAACNDNNACTTGDLCAAGECQGTTVDCSDGNTCTSDACTPVGGCASTTLPAGTPCADANACNGAETCQAGVCTAGTALVCNDNNVCTNDSCDAALGCRFTDVTNGISCVDADVCDGAESCQGGVCTNGTALNCDDSNNCTVDSCSAVSGCAHVAGSCNAPNVTCGAAIATTPLATVTLSGSGSDPDGGVVTYRWTVTSAPGGSSSTPSSPNSSTSLFFVDLAGEYELTLTVTDNEGETSSCIVRISAVPPQDLHIELIWDTAWGDADLHLLRNDVTPTATTLLTTWFSTGQSSVDCWYGSDKPNWFPQGADNNPVLDIDDTAGFGPENINISQNPGNSQGTGVFTIGIAYYCSYGLATRDGGQVVQPAPGDGPATATVRVYCGGNLAGEITNISLDRTGRFVTVGTVDWPTCAITTSKAASWVPMPAVSGANNPYHCTITCTNDNNCPPAEHCSAGSCKLD